MTRAEYDEMTAVPSRLLNGDQVRRLRKSRRLTLQDVSQGTGVSVSFLSDIERGKANPTLDTYTTLISFYETVAP